MANATEVYDDYYYYGGDDGSHSCQPPPGAGDFLCAAYSLTFALGLPANLLLLLLAAGAQAWQRGPGVAPGPFVPALALADLILVLPLPLWADTWRQEGSWRFSEGACRVGAYLAAAGAHASVLLLALTSLERLLAAARPGTHGRLRPRSRALLLALGGLGHSPDPGHARAPASRPGGRVRPGGGHLLHRDGTLHPGLSLAYWAGTFALPLGLVLACNWKVGRRLRTGPLLRRRRDQRLRRSVALVRAVAAAFAACWLPFRALQVAGLAVRWRGGAPSCSLRWAQEVTAPLAFASAVANPAVYLLCAEWPRRTLGSLLARQGSAEATGSLHTSSVTLG